jgi:putative ATP-dependent endonuclease of OLD family
MYISKVKIENYRGFTAFSAELSKVTLIVGENESGKTNFFTALSLPLGSNNISFSQKRLKVSDINTDSILAFYSSIIDGESAANIRRKIPVVSVEIEIRDPADEYEETLLKNWLTDDPSGSLYAIKYEFLPKSEVDLVQAVELLLAGVKAIEESRWFTFPSELYEYQITSVNNGKQISFHDLNRLTINNIDAERDDFSQDSTMKANSMLTKMLVNTLDPSEKATINKAYTDFFKSIEGTETFEKIISLDPDFENFAEHIKDIECIPNLPNLKNILSNITLKTGHVFLYQRGLGERNLIYILILFEFFKNNKKYFNLCCIEEPEAHLSVNNLRLVTDFIYKSTKGSEGLLQTLISSHNPSVINKLELSNVVVFSGRRAISLKDNSDDLQDYLRKRPNFDILKLLFAHRLILVEGTTEEMLINTILQKQANLLSSVEVLAIGQKGFRIFLDIWLTINQGNNQKKIGIVRDFDNQVQSRTDHEKYDLDHENICVRTTENYTLEDDLAGAGNNLTVMRDAFELNADCTNGEASEYMKKNKAEAMLVLCDAMTADKNPKEIVLPPHIQQVVDFVS